MPGTELPDESLRLRVLSAAVLVPLAVAAAYAGGWVFVTLIGVGVVLLANEWDRLCGGEGVRGVLGVLHAGVLLAAVVLAGADLFLAAAVVAAVGSAGAALLAPQFGRARAWPAAGIIYFAAPAIAILWLRSEPDGRQCMLWLLALVWATDVGAIAVGRTLKGPRLAPKISPAKTWSGFSGGLAGAVLVGAGAAWLTGFASLAVMVVVSAGLSLVSQIGDLVESAVKRHYGVKDSGTLIPGHGGILDRVDGLLLTAPVAAVLAWVNGGGDLLWH